MKSIEIILKKDVNGNDIDLNNMSLDTSKSVREILDALIGIVAYEKELDLKIGLEKGSAAQKIMSPSEEHLSVVYNKIAEASENKPTRDNFYVNKLNVIHRNFESFQEYSVFYDNASRKKDIKSLFEHKFKSSRSKAITDNHFDVQFFKGSLEQIGGKKPNFHLYSRGQTFTIQCTQEQAKKVNPFLYQEIAISAWLKNKNNKTEYTFCDLYAGESEKYLDDFSSFFKELANKRGTAPFHFISDKLATYYDAQDYIAAKKLIRVFLTSSSLPIYLRTILVMSKAFKEEAYLKDVLIETESLLSTKIEKVY